MPLSTSGSGASGVVGGGGGGGGTSSGIAGVGGVGAPASAANTTGSVSGTAGLLVAGAGAVMDGGTPGGPSSASGSHASATSSSSSSTPAPVGKFGLGSLLSNLLMPSTLSSLLCHFLPPVISRDVCVCRWSECCPSRRSFRLAEPATRSRCQSPFGSWRSRWCWSWNR